MYPKSWSDIEDIQVSKKDFLSSHSSLTLVRRLDNYTSNYKDVWK